ncbi:methylenetetrahydrofolate reductase [Primorskyibacter aestuariivivens]|uniref:methylenetetrahydrofolate reductase n=1 Tax=Primorskyibacter aestuariivivens TaxID=1888912 RepID=UPI002301F95D|nr:methylenetetrahydrofolate reductase [Primorskyibacter aestuariivivens]MDA7428607.1 methylenetetrahydrofolate reductase [Primorskyibacter aestuariivivens]
MDAPFQTDQPQDALLRTLYEAQERLPLSFEVFPPKNATGRAALEQTVDHLAPLAQHGFSVTMARGGATRDGTVETVTDIAARTGRPVMAHLVSLGLTRDEALQTADQLWRRGIRHILALRGDRPDGAFPPGFAYASELVAALRAQHDFEIAVAAHPETHPEADSPEQDIDHLKRKLDAGAETVYCQFALDPAAYGRFVEACAKRGINVPIIPGLMPLEGWSRVRRFALMNGAVVPDWLDHMFARAAANPEIEPYLAAAITVEHARHLVAYGAPAIHVYTMNRWPLPMALASFVGQR